MNRWRSHLTNAIRRRPRPRPIDPEICHRRGCSILVSAIQRLCESWDYDWHSIGALTAQQADPVAPAQRPQGSGVRCVSYKGAVLILPHGVRMWGFFLSLVHNRCNVRLACFDQLQALFLHDLGLLHKALDIGSFLFITGISFFIVVCS